MEKDLLEFLKYHKIDDNDIIDAKGSTIYEIRDKMKENNILFAFNTTPCEKAGHTIRDRHSHCIVCHTSQIAFMKRTKETGNIYIAGSIIKNFIKVGMTTEDVEKRIGKLNSRKVGQTNDWVAIKMIKCDYANIVELGIHKELKKYKVDGVSYDENTESNEIFRCKYENADTVLENYIDKNNIQIKETKTFIMNKDKYNNFRNILNPKYSNK